MFLISLIILLFFISDILFPHTSHILPLLFPPHFLLVAPPLISPKKMKSHQKALTHLSTIQSPTWSGSACSDFSLSSAYYFHSLLHHPNNLQTCSGVSILNHLHTSSITSPFSARLLQQLSTYAVSFLILSFPAFLHRLLFAPCP